MSGSHPVKFLLPSQHDSPCKVAVTMKFVSFNINGLRARPHQLEAIVEKHQPDVIGLQETKVHDEMFPLEEVAKLGYNVFYHGQKGHYGVALLTKATPISVRRGFPDDGEEAQRRIIMAEIPSPLGNITVINGYFPQGESRDHPLKFPAKAQFYQNLQNYLETELKCDNPVLIMGDMNISPTDLDIGIGEENRKRWLRTGKCSFLPEEREWMSRLLKWGLVDTCGEAIIFALIGDATNSSSNQQWRDLRGNLGILHCAEKNDLKMIFLHWILHLNDFRLNRFKSTFNHCPNS